MKVRLEVAGEQSEVTVFGTAEGVRADAQIGLRLAAQPDRRSPDPRPQGHDSPAPERGLPPGEGDGRSLRQRDVLRHRRRLAPRHHLHDRRRRPTTRGGAARRRSPPCRSAPCSEIAVLSNSFSTEYGWTSGAALNMVTKSGTNDLHGDLLYLIRPGGNLQAKSFSTEQLLPRLGLDVRDAFDARVHQPRGHPRHAGPGLRSRSAGRSSATRHCSSLAADYTAQNRVAPLSPTLPAFVLPADGSLDVHGPLPADPRRRAGWTTASPTART